MADIEKRVGIARSPAAVRAVILDAERATSWQGSLEIYEQLTPDPVGQGTRSRGVTALVGVRMEWTAEVVEWTERGWVWKSVESDPEWEIRWTLDGAGGRTDLTFEQWSPSLEGVKRAIVRGIVGGQVEKDLEALRQMVEGG